MTNIIAPLSVELLYIYKFSIDSSINQLQEIG